MANRTNDLGGEISRQVQEALRSGDFSGLKVSIRETVDEIRDAVMDDVRSAAQTVHTYTDAGKKRVVYTYEAESAASARRKAHRPAGQVPVPPRPAPLFPVSIPGRTSAVLMTVLGILGLVIFGGFYGLGMLGALVSGDMPGAAALSAVMAPVFIGLGAVTAVGSGRQRLISRFRRYRKIMRDARFWEVERLAASTAQTKESVLRDLRKMMRRGMFLDARLDAQETTLMLDEATYRQYLETMDAARRREEEAASRQEDDSVRAVIAEGRRYIAAIREANDAIPEEALSAKLYRLEEITAKVFACVERHPEKVPDIRKFMNYYLPTTLKLVNAYREFDAQPVSGGKIASAKEEIRDVLDTINGAFANFLDELFAEDVLDITSDISALESVLARDGLTGSDFAPEKKP